MPPNPKLLEGNVLLLWNPADDESTLIAAAYLTYHPGVYPFALEDELPGVGIDYEDYPPESELNHPLCEDCENEPCQTCAACAPSYNAECICCSCPSFAIGAWEHLPGSPRWAMDKYYITPDMYEQFIAQPVREFLEEHEEIVAIATTRGVPATISESFEARTNHSFACIKGSVESRLAGLNFTGRTNPYKGHVDIPFKTWIIKEATVCDPDGGLQFNGKIFLTSRLDSDRQFDGDLEPYGTHADAVIELIERSQNLTVNKFGCTIVIDHDVPSAPFAMAQDAGNYFRERRWPVYYEDTSAVFLHGLYEPGDECGEFHPNVEGQYATYWPELVHYTPGRNSEGPGSEAVCNDYVKRYNPHRAGLFLSYESFNGLALRDPTWPYANDHASGGWTHGSVLQWIGRGGAFTIGGVNGWAPPPGGVYAVANLYESGLSWGEAAWTEIGSFTSFDCPIGDPLARVKVYDPDLTDDGVIDQDDVDIVQAHWGEGGPEGDIDGNGIINHYDLYLLYEGFGRDAYAFPSLPPPVGHWPVPAPSASQCGDLTGDRVVDQSDLDFFDDRYVACNNGYEPYSGMFDVNHDYVLSNADRIIIAGNIQDPSHCLLDVNEDGCLSTDDHLSVIQFLVQCGQSCDPTNPNWNPLYDVNCNQRIDDEDEDIIRSHLKHCWQCPNCPDPPPCD